MRGPGGYHIDIQVNRADSDCIVLGCVQSSAYPHACHTGSRNSLDGPGGSRDAAVRHRGGGRFGRTAHRAAEARSSRSADRQRYDQADRCSDPHADRNKPAICHPDRNGPAD